MTNNYAIQIHHEGKPYIFCVTDSQTTAHHTKRTNAPKLVQHGHNLIMCAGRSDIVYGVYTHLPPLDTSPLAAYDLAEIILKETAKIPPVEQCDDSTSFLVMGKDKESDDKLRMYEVSIDSCETHGERRSINPIDSIDYIAGSSSSHVRAALLRDGEMGFFEHPTNPLDALYLLFLVGKKAEMDIGVDERLQLGFVSPSAIRVLRAPGVEHLSPEHANRYVHSLAGIPSLVTQDMAERPHARETKPARDRYVAVSRTIDEFYKAWETQMYRLLNADFLANSIHTRLKAGTADIGDYQRALEQRRLEVDSAKQIVDAFMQGGIETIVGALRQFHHRQETFYEAAIQASRA